MSCLRSEKRSSETVAANGNESDQPHHNKQKTEKQNIKRSAGEDGDEVFKETDCKRRKTAVGDVPGNDSGGKIENHKVKIANVSNGEECCTINVAKTTSRDRRGQVTVGSLTRQIVSAAGIQEDDITLFLPDTGEKLLPTTKLVDCDWPTTLLLLIERTCVVAKDTGVEVSKLTDSQLCSWAERTSPEEVISVKLTGCRKVTDVRCLTVFTHMEQLHLAGCSVGSGSLTAVVLSCKRLTALDASSNRLELNNTLANALLEHPDLTSLNMLGNTIGIKQALNLATFLDASIKLTTLCGFTGEEAELDLSGKGLSAGCAVLVANEVKVNRALASVDLSVNSIGGYFTNKGEWNEQFTPTPEGLEAVAKAIQHCRALTSVNLSSTSLRAEDAKAIAEVLPQCESLTSLEVSGSVPSWSSEGPAFAKHIAEGIKGHPALTSMNILGNGIDDEQARNLIAVLDASDKLTTLCGFTGNETELDLSKKGLRAGCAMLVANEMKVNRALTSVNLSGNKLSAEGTKAVAEVLPQCEALTSVNLSGSKLYAKGVKAVAEVLLQCESLTSMNILGNGIDDEQARNLIAVLDASDKLTTLCGFTGNETELDLSKKGLCAGCTVLVANEMKVNRALTSVNLKENRIEAEGAKAVAATLPLCKALTSVNILGNNIGEEQARSLISILDASDKLTTLCGFAGNATELDLSKKGLSSGCAVLVANEIKVNRALTSFTFSGDKHYSTAVTLEVNMSEVDMGNKALGPSGAAMAAVFLPRMDNGIGDEQARNLIGLLDASDKLTTLCGFMGDEIVLDLSRQALSSSCAMLVANEMKVNKALTSLDVSSSVPSWSSDGPAFAKHIAEGIKGHVALTSFDLSQNNIGAEGAKAVAEVLPQCESMTSFTFSGDAFDSKSVTLEVSMAGVDMSNKVLGPSGAIMAAAFLPRMEALANITWGDGGQILSVDASLAAMDFSRKGLRSHDAQIVASMLPKCTALTLVDLSGNTLDLSGLQAIVHALPECKHIQEIDVTSCCDIGISIPDSGGVLMDRQALYRAAYQGNAVTLKALLSGNRAANLVNQRDRDGAPLLHTASRKGHRDCVKVLLDAGADVSTQDLDDGTTPCYMAAYAGHADVLMLLIDMKADVNQLAMDDRSSPIYAAARKGHADCVTLLLEAGAEPRKTTNEGEDARQVAVRKEHSEIVEIIDCALSALPL